MASVFFFGTEPTLLAETRAFNQRAQQAGALTVPLQLVDGHIRAMMSQGAYQSLDQWVDARYGVVLLAGAARPTVTQLVPVVGDGLRYVGTSGAATGVPYAPSGAGGLSGAVLDNSVTPAAALAGSIVGLSNTQDYTWGIRLNLLSAPEPAPIIGNRYGTPASWVNVGAEVQYVNDPANNGADNSIRGYTIPQNQWQYLWLVKSGTNLRFYRNDALLGESTITTGMPTLPFYVGGDATNGANSLQNNSMYFQSVRRWRVALSAAQRTTLQF